MKKNILFLFCLLMFVICLFGCGKTYTVTFVYNNGQENTSVEVKDASEIELPTASKEGYNFGGWYLDSEGKTLFTEHYKLEDNITLYAYWKLKEFDVNFYVNDELIDTQKVKYGEDATAPTVDALTKYDFKAWDKEFTNVKSNLVVHAVLEIKKFTVVFMKDSEVIKSELIASPALYLSSYALSVYQPANTYPSAVNVGQLNASPYVIDLGLKSSSVLPS